MAKRKAAITQEPYGHNPSIYVAYELPFGRDLMKPGDVLKIKNQRGTYRFLKVAHNADLDVTWVDVMNVKDGQYHSFYVEKIKLIVRPKKSRRKKQSVI